MAHVATNTTVRLHDAEQFDLPRRYVPSRMFRVTEIRFDRHPQPLQRTDRDQVVTLIGRPLDRTGTRTLKSADPVAYTYDLDTLPVPAREILRALNLPLAAGYTAFPAAVDARIED